MKKLLKNKTFAEKIVSIFYISVLLSIIYLIYSIMSSEKQILNQTNRHENPTLFFSDQLIQDYLHHSQVVRTGVNSYEKVNKVQRRVCLRPYFGYQDDRSKDNAENAKSQTYGECKPLEIDEIINLTLQPKEALGQFDISRQIRTNLLGQGHLYYSNHQPILAKTETKIKIVLNHDDAKKSSTEWINSKFLSEYGGSNCAVSVNHQTDTFKLNSNCNGSEELGEVSVQNQHGEKIAALRRTKENGVEFQPVQENDWKEVAKGNQAKLYHLCQDNVSVKYIKTSPDAPSLHITCERPQIHKEQTPQAYLKPRESSLKQMSETKRLATLFTAYSDTDIVTTLDKSLTEKMDAITKKYCTEWKCQAKVLIMKSSTGEILALSAAHKNRYEGQVVANFKPEPIGSVAKVIFSQAILLQNLNFSNLQLHRLDTGITKEYSKGQGTYSLVNRTGRLLDWKNDNMSSIDYYNKDVGSVDFNQFIAISNNAYPVALMFLANFHPTRTFDANKELNLSEMTGWSAVENGSNANSEVFKNYASHKTYYPLFENTEGKNMERFMIREEVPKWMHVLNNYYGVNFYHKDLTFYGNYRHYIWGGLRLNPILFPEREHFNNKACANDGYFRCRMYAWILGESGALWSSITVAEVYSSIATNRQIAASIVPQRQNMSIVDDNTKKVNQILRTAMKGVVTTADNGTAKSLQDFTNNFQLIAKTGTASVAINPKNNISLRNQQIKVVEQALAPYDYSLISEKQKQEVIKKLGLHPYFIAQDNNHRQLTSVGKLVNDVIQGQAKLTEATGDADGTTEEKRLVLVVAPKQGDISQEMTNACTIVISAYNGEDDKMKYVNLDIAKDILEYMTGDDILNKCSTEPS